ncbi:MAG: hydroxymethylglutaryl-CoA lyase [Blastocatellia bacterium]|nr:hydroxymethylglutaryl-CoA lyase [Blastocatellia bacterium]MDW8166881.1 hydroxymethylglutaryl-CoA lyase [Acidobacteriota bacterium]
MPLLPEAVEIVEVGPRDGLQSLPFVVPTSEKIALIRGLLQAGLRRIEATSFVHPKVIPQLKDAEELLSGLDVPEGVRLIALVPNERGYERARRCRPVLTDITLVVAATETLNQKNVRMSISESLRQFERIVAMAKADGFWVRAIIGASFGCPYEGRVPIEQVMTLAKIFFHMGSDEVTFADTIGCANPAQTHYFFAQARQRWPDRVLSAHFHDTRHMALANIYAALQVGITIFDAAIGGLGGCPFSPGAAGNVATEKVVLMLHEMGIRTGVDLTQLRACAQMATAISARGSDLHEQQLGL